MPRADDNGPFKAFDPVDIVEEGLKEFYQRFEDAQLDFDMPDFRRHLRNARKEQLLAMRALIDRAIEQLEKQEQHEAGRA